MEEVVYILTNECMPGLVKIGFTSTSVEQRMRELYNSSAVPLPFVCHYAAVVKDGKRVEKRLHFAFDSHRFSPKREFFKIDPSRVVAVLELLAIREVTPQNNSDEIAELQEYEKRRPRFEFRFANIPIGAELSFVRDEEQRCKVVDQKTIEYQGEKKSLSGLASELLRKAGRKSTQVQGPLFWLYEGETLEERRQRIKTEASTL